MRKTAIIRGNDLLIRVTCPLLCRTYNVLDDQELRESIKEYSSWPTIPQVYLKGDFLGGCDIMLSSMFRFKV